MKAPMLLLIAGLALPMSAQPTLRLHGSTTVQAALEPCQHELEQLSGTKLEINAFASTSGLIALANGTADIAMISSPLGEVAHRINERKPGAVAERDYEAAPIGTMRLVFIVNPRNTVRHLTTAQLVGIFAGWITNWSELGGANAPILVVTLANAGPLVEDKLLGGAKITDKARAVASAMQIPPVIAQEEGAIGIVSAAHAHARTSVISTDVNISAPLLLVTKGAPTTAERKLFEAAREILSERHS